MATNLGFREWLLAEIERLGSQAELCRRTNLRSSVVSRLLAPGRRPRAETIRRLTVPLGVPPEIIELWADQDGYHSTGPQKSRAVVDSACARCGKTLQVIRSKAERPYCGKRCADLDQLSTLPPPEQMTAFQRLLLAPVLEAGNYRTLAIKAGLSTGTIRNLLRGGHPTEETLAGLASALAMPLGELRAVAGGAWDHSAHSKAISAHRRNGEVRRCRACRTKMYIVPSLARVWKGYCGECAPRGAKKLAHRAWNPLQVRLLEHAGNNVAAFCRQVSLPTPRIYRWFAQNGSAASEETLRRLASGLDIPFAKALAEAGGVTAEEIHRAQGMARMEAGVLKGRGRKGARHRRPRSAEHREKLAASRARTGADERFKAATLAANKTVAATIRKGLFVRLIRQRQPTPEVIERWAGDVATTPTVKLSAEAVLAFWKPYLVRRGLWSDEDRGSVTGGVHSPEKRHAASRVPKAYRGLHAFILERKPRVRAPNGWWEDHLDPCAREAGYEEPQAGWDNWFKHHIRHCSDPGSCSAKKG